MRYLFLDTSTKSLHIGIVEDETVLYELHLELVQEHSQKTIPELEKAFQETKLTPQDIDRIIVVNGPGSFTGIRIGLTIAKVYAWALQIPIVPISGLQAMAYSIVDCDYIVSMLDARHGNVYGAIYDGTYQPVLREQFIELDQLMEQVQQLDGKVIFTTDVDFNCGYDLVRPSYDLMAIVSHMRDVMPVNVHSLNPNYLKQTQAEENLKGGQ